MMGLYRGMVRWAVCLACASGLPGQGALAQGASHAANSRDAFLRYLVLVPKGRGADDARKKIEKIQKQLA